MAKLLDSVAPDVNIISLGLAPIKSEICWTNFEIYYEKL